MPVQTPTLSKKQWDQRVYDAQIGSLYPVQFAFSGGSFTSGDGGAMQYITQSYTIPSFCGLAQIDADESGTATLTVIQYEYVIVSFLPTPTLADAASQPVDAGNILYSQPICFKLTGKPQARNFSPGFIPLHKNQVIYIHVVQVPAIAVIEATTVILHFAQTGLQI